MAAVVCILVTMTTECKCTYPSLYSNGNSPRQGRDFHSSSFRSCTDFNFTAKESVVHSKAPGPLTSYGIEGVSVRPAQLTHLRLHANVAEGVGQQGLDRDQHLGQGQARDPIALLNRVNPNVAMTVHIRVEDLGEKAHLGRFKWVEHRNF